MFSANGFVEIRMINTNAQLSVRCKHYNHGINLCCKFLLLNDNPSLLYAIKFLLDFDTESERHTTRCFTGGTTKSIFVSCLGGKSLMPLMHHYIPMEYPWEFSL